MEIHPSARKHGIADEDITHAKTNAMAIEDQDDDARLYLGPVRNADMLEVVTIVRDDGSEFAIHGMAMRASTSDCCLEDEHGQGDIRQDLER